MDYSELLLSLQVRKIARGRMINEIRDKDKNNELSVKEVMEKVDDLNYASYVEEVLSDAKETAFIIRSID